MSDTSEEFTAVLGGLQPQQFLDQHWQKKPLLVRNAFPDITPLFSAEELAGLCCETDTNSKLVIENGKSPWQVIYPPFSDETFLNLPEKNWTLLVNQLETHFPQLQQLLEAFHFIPQWRIDDLMVSYAVDGGNVGPHTDEYDVFLIQLQGKRRWQLDTQANPKNIREGLELAILKTFNVDEEWVLESGDMLYLPPGVGHHGVALGDCMTYSVGFRSPSKGEMLASYLEAHILKPNNAERYCDLDRKTQSSSGEIDKEDIDQLKNMMLEALTPKDDDIRLWLGRFLTDNDDPVSDNLSRDRDDPGSISPIELSNQEYNPALDYQKNPQHKIAWINNDKSIMLFISGECSHWPKHALDLIEYISANHLYCKDTIGPLSASTHNRTLLSLLIKTGAIIPV